MAGGLASIGMLPQVVVLLVSGRLVGPVLRKVGMGHAAWMSAAAVVLGLAVFAAGGRFGYIWIALALVLVAAGMRIVGVVAGTNVMTGLPENRTTIGAAMVDTSSQVATGIGIAVTGTILAALFTGTISSTTWSTDQAATFQTGVTVAGLALTAAASVLVLLGMVRARSGRGVPERAHSEDGDRLAPDHLMSSTGEGHAVRFETSGTAGLSSWDSEDGRGCRRFAATAHGNTYEEARSCASHGP